MDIPKIIQNSNIQFSDINKVIHFESIVDNKLEKKFKIKTEI